MTANGEPGASEESVGVTNLSIPDIRTSPMPAQTQLQHHTQPHTQSPGHVLPNGNGSHKTGSSIVIDSQPKRKVSIISDAPMSGGSGPSSLGIGGGGVGGGAAGYDNLAFEQNPRRKISQVSGVNRIE